MGLTRLRTLPIWLCLGLLIPSAAPRAVAVQERENVSWPRIALYDTVGGLDRPVHITHAGDGSGRLFVVEQPGRVRIIARGSLRPEPFLDITDRVSCCGERGLLSIAFPPGYAEKDYFYVNYTDRNGDTVVGRYRVGADPEVAGSTTEEIILKIDQPYANHNGGQLAFGPRDGYLYVGMGDGGGGGDPQGRAQNAAELLGKLLRIDVESADRGYRIPPSNPYTETRGFRGEIWALGLRNPWRFSFDRRTGDLYIADVGQGAYEEIDFQPATSAGGENYGWNIMEGAHCFRGEGCERSGLVLPIAEYERSGGHCAVVGGMVYRGPGNPHMQGTYFYADYCSGSIWGLKREGPRWRSALLYEPGFAITSFGEDQQGNLYVADYSNGAIHRIGEAPPTHIELLRACREAAGTQRPSLVRWALCLARARLAAAR